MEGRRRSQWKTGGSKWSPGGSIYQRLQIPMTFNMSLIRIRIIAKSWIRIRIKRILNLTVGWVAPLLYDGEQSSCPPPLLAPGAPSLLIHATERVTLSWKQCCGSMTFWGGSGSAEHNFFCLLLFEATFTSFFKEKK